MLKLSKARHFAVFLTVFLVFSQAVFLLPLNIQVVVATVDNSVFTDDDGTTDETVSFISPQAGAQLGGETEIQVSINSGNYLIENVYLHEYNRKITVRQMDLDSSTGYYVCNWDTVNAENGDYNLYIRIDWNHTSKEDYSSPLVNFTVYNEQAPEVPETVVEDDDSAGTVNPINPSVTFLDKPAFINGPLTLSAQANFDISAMAFSVTGPINKTYTGIAKGANAFFFKWDVIGGAFPFGAYVLKASALLSGMEYSDTLNVKYSEENYESTEPVIVPKPLEITFSPALQSPISGEQKISVNLTKDVEKVEFMVEGPVNKKYEGIKVSARDFYFNWDTDSVFFPDGYYKVTAGAINTGVIEGENYFNIEVKNNINSETEPKEDAGEFEALTVSILGQISPPIFGNYTITAVPSQTVDSVSFHILGPVEKTFNGIKNNDNHYFFIWPTTEFINGFYKLNIVAKKGVVIATKSVNLEIKNQLAPNTQLILEKETAVVNEQILPECVRNGIETTEECKLFMLLSPECREKGIKNKMECDVFLSLPLECRARNLSREACNNYLSMPRACRAGNITVLAECENYMFQKAMPLQCRVAGAKTQEECAGIIVLKSLPPRCLEAGIGTADQCAALINFDGPTGEAAIKKVINPQTGEKAEIPGKCQVIGILNPEQCQAYLKEKYLPPECRENEIYNTGECDKMMFAKYGPNECREAGISGVRECESYMLNKYSQEINCGDNESWQCNNYIKEMYLGNIVAKQAQFAELKEKADLSAGKAINAKKLKDSLTRAKSMVPVKEDEVNLKFVAANGKMVFKDKDDFIQTSPLVLMIDSDGDGLPDDIEKRYGTDPNNEDSDSDGYSDYMEIKNGYNPLGAGKFNKNLMAPVEKAIMDNADLEHPKTEGKINDNYQVNKIIDNRGQEESRPGYIFSGQAEPNSVLTLYIYSDLPVVTTVRTNEFGNWEYEFTKSLIEGEHEVYIALNDNTGRVISKSNPLNFFIKEARAVTLEDFLAAAAVEKTPQADSMISFYIIIAAAVIIVGVFMFVILLNIYKNRQRA